MASTQELTANEASGPKSALGKFKRADRSRAGVTTDTSVNPPQVNEHDEPTSTAQNNTAHPAAGGPKTSNVYDGDDGSNGSERTELTEPYAKDSQGKEVKNALEVVNGNAPDERDIGGQKNSAAEKALNKNSGRHSERLKERDWAELRNEDRAKERHSRGHRAKFHHGRRDHRHRHSNARSPSHSRSPSRDRKRNRRHSSPRSHSHSRRHHHRQHSKSRSPPRSADNRRSRSRQRGGSGSDHGRQMHDNDRGSEASSRSLSNHRPRGRSLGSDDSRSESPPRRPHHRRDSRNRGKSRRGHLGGRGGRGVRGARGGAYRAHPPPRVERPESNDPDQIRRQVEFYFSEANLHRDAFLLERTEGATNKPIPIKVISEFSRMKHFKPYQDVVKALRGSEILEVVETGGLGTEEVKRKTPISDEYSTTREGIYDNASIFKEKVFARTAFVHGWKQDYPNQQEEIENFLRPMGNNILSIRLTRSQGKVFQGSADVVLENVDDMINFVEMFEGGKEYDKDDSVLYATSKQNWLDERKARSNAIKQRAESERKEKGQVKAVEVKDGPSKPDENVTQDRAMTNTSRINLTDGVTGESNVSIGEKRARDEDAENENEADERDTKRVRQDGRRELASVPAGVGAKRIRDEDTEVEEKEVEERDIKRVRQEEKAGSPTGAGSEAE